MARQVKYVYRTSEVPPMKSDFMDSLAKHFLRKYEFWQWSRTDLVDRWMECLEAYNGIRTLPEIETMQYVSQGDRGEPDVFFGVERLARQLSLATMDKNETWLTIVSRKMEDPMITNAVRAQQAWVHRKANTRRTFARHLKQMIVMGTSHILLNWEPVYLLKRIGTGESRRKLSSLLKTAGRADASRLVGQARVQELKFNGPRMQVLDNFDVLVDPEVDVTRDPEPGVCVQQYFRIEELQSMEYDDGQKVFSNLEGLETMRSDELYYQSLEGQAREQAKSMATGTVVRNDYSDVMAKFVKVLVFNLPIVVWEGEQFIDYYFYVAVDGNNNARMIRVEENPCDAGHRLIVTDHYIDYWAPAAYGISGVEKTVGWLDTKNFIEAAKVNAIAASIWPAVVTAAGAFKDVPDWTPGAVNELAQLALSENVIAPMPVPKDGIQIGTMTEQYYEQKINSSFESIGAVQQNQQRVDRETAASVNYRASSQGVLIDDQAEKFGNSLQTICQWTLDMSIQTAIPDGKDSEGDDVLGYSTIAGGGAQRQEIKISQFKEPRDVEVLGLHGAVNKAQGVDAKQKGMDSLGRLGQFMPNTPALAQKLVKAYYNDLNIETSPEDWLTPQQLAAQDPQVQIMALQNGLQNPQLLMQVMGIQPPGAEQGAPPDAQQQGPPGPQPQVPGQ
jgi:hypothetical protein